MAFPVSRSPAYLAETKSRETGEKWKYDHDSSFFFSVIEPCSLSPEVESEARPSFDSWLAISVVTPPQNTKPQSLASLTFVLR
jgi:hypothetical protein